MTWNTRILPFIEQNAMWETVAWRQEGTTIAKKRQRKTDVCDLCTLLRQGNLSIALRFFFGLILRPAIQMVRESGRRMVCTNNIRQLALGLMNYESSHGQCLKNHVLMATSFARTRLSPPTG
jgi:hypothetical protein